MADDGLLVLGTWERAREYIALVLQHHSRTRKEDWRDLLSDSLRALNYGEVQPLTTPSPTRKHGRHFTLYRLRWIAVLHVHVLLGGGMKKYAAEVRIADELAVSVETLRAWEKRFLRENKGLKQDILLARTIAPNGLDQLQRAEERLWAKYGKSDDFTAATPLHDKLRKHPTKVLARELRQAKAR